MSMMKRRDTPSVVGAFGESALMARRQAAAERRLRVSTQWAPVRLFNASEIFPAGWRHVEKWGSLPEQVREEAWSKGEPGAEKSCLKSKTCAGDRVLPSNGALVIGSTQDVLPVRIIDVGVWITEDLVPGNRVVFIMGGDLPNSSAQNFEVVVREIFSCDADDVGLCNDSPNTVERGAANRWSQAGSFEGNFVAVIGPPVCARMPLSDRRRTSKGFDGKLRRPPSSAWRPWGRHGTAHATLWD
eukprot:CAMPEP_0170262134 /NCGR_PEP_ID=MMETSP0116_2-20130129/30951_1 /TAXON_ID=400756 /ORGANISM="Durinskia baltica, Strain CSIRO CS-38" /LENGTH=242 /DNA_ID=CAMNT_0010513205 /DNA_START=58 /DNA_END=787 /DNA_ORIENTATION=-